MQVKPTDTVNSLKTKILDNFIATGAPIDRNTPIQLFYKKLELKGEKALSEYHLHEGSELLIWRPSTYLYRPTIGRAE